MTPVENSDFISSNYKVFLTRQEIYDIQIKLKGEKFVDAICHLTDIIKNQQCQQWDLVTTLRQHDFTWQKQGLTTWKSKMSYAQTTEHTQLPRQPGASTQAGLECERLIRDTFPVHSLPLKWTANTRVQDVLSQHDNLQDFRDIA